MQPAVENARGEDAFSCQKMLKKVACTRALHGLRLALAMRASLCFEDLKTALSHTLICPCPLEAEALLARALPSAKGPAAELSGDTLRVEGVPWRFRNARDAKRVSGLLECYFRKFDPEYTVCELEDPAKAVRASASVR